MNAVALDVLFVDDEGPVAAAAAEHLRERGHAVRVVGNLELALAHGDPDVLLSAVELSDGTGLELLAALRARGSRTRAVLLGRLTCADEMRTALRLDVCELLERPCELSELVAAVESGPVALTPAPEVDLPSGGHMHRSLRSEPDEIDDGLRELSSFLVRGGVSPTTRMRAVTAVAELLDNVRAHAYPDDLEGVFGRAELSAELSPRKLIVRISDQGQGFESGRDAPVADPREKGLARAAVLSENLRIESVRGFGSCVTLDFHAYSTEFSGDEIVDLCELDWLTPGLTRRVLAGLEDGEEPAFHFSPAQAVAVGRLLAGCSDHQRAGRALWSA